MKTEEIKEKIEIIVGGAEEIKPVIRNLIKMVDDYLPEIQPSIEKTLDYVVDSNIRMIDRLVTSGYKRQEAIEIVGNIMASIRPLKSKGLFG